MPVPNEVARWLLTQDPQNQSKIVIETPGIKDSTVPTPLPPVQDHIKLTPQDALSNIKGAITKA